MRYIQLQTWHTVFLTAYTRKLRQTDFCMTVCMIFEDCLARLFCWEFICHCFIVWSFLSQNMASARSLIGYLSTNNIKLIRTRTLQAAQIRPFSVCNSCVYRGGHYSQTALTKGRCIQCRSSTLIFTYNRFDILSAASISSTTLLSRDRCRNFLDPFGRLESSVHIGHNLKIVFRNFIYKLPKLI